MSKSFGEKLLDKMGFDRKGYLGKNRKNYQEKIIKAIPRQSGLGLGADNEQAQQDAIQSNVELQKNPGDIKKFDKMFVFDGQHKGITGIVYEIKGDKIHLNINQKIIQIERKNLVHEKYRHNYENKKEQKLEQNQYQWVELDLKVRFVSKSFNSGKYYLKKARVINIQSLNNITLIFEDKNIIDNINQYDLETIVSKKDSKVKIVVGKLQKQIVKNKQLKQSQKILTLYKS